MELTQTQEERVFVVESPKTRHPQMVYIGKKLPVFLLSAKGTRVVSNFIPDELVPEALRLVREQYVGKYKLCALMDFFTRVNAFVNEIYSGSEWRLKWLKERQEFVLDNKDLFVMAVHAVSTNPNREFPCLTTEDGFDPEVLRVLRGEVDESSLDIPSKISALVDQIYAVVEKGKGKKKKIKYLGIKLVIRLAKVQPGLVLAYADYFEEFVSRKPREKFPPQRYLGSGLNPDVLAILRGWIQQHLTERAFPKLGTLLFYYFFNPSSIVKRFENMLATVRGHTQPGTGVISFTKSFTLSKSISHTAFQSL